MVFYKKYFLVPIFSIFIFAAAFAQEPDSIKNAQLEARKDSLKLAKALQMQASFKNRLTPDAETAPVESLTGEDAADDPAIWVNTENPDKSLILGTNKKAGIYVYNLKGETQQFVRAGKINNVDLRNNFIYKGEKVALVVGSNRSLNAISVFILNPKTGRLSDTIANIVSGVDEVYGICMYRNQKTNQFYAIVNGKGGKIEQWEIFSANTEIKYKKIRSFSVTTQPEGMVADDLTGILYLGVEDEGIYKSTLNADTFQLSLIKESSQLIPAITYDIEGLSLFIYKQNTYLIASVQGNFSYAIFNVSKNDKYIGSFTIIDGLIDGAEETDGLDITTANCGELYPNGLLVVQDGFNKNVQMSENQNFKIVSFSKIIPFLK
jgi:3-phytase